jgi:hypothetical protein
MPEVTHVGTVAALIEKKNGWYTVEVSVPGKQYPVKADTKLEPLLKQVREIRDAGLVATFTMSESDSENTNPNTGRPYIERRLEKVTPGAQNQSDANDSPSGAVQGSGAEGMTPEKWDAKERRDYRSRAWAQVLSTFEHTIKTDEDPLEAVKRLQPAQRYVFEDVCGTFAYPEDDSDLPF